MVFGSSCLIMETLVHVGWTPRLIVPVCTGLRTVVVSAILALLGGQQITDPLMMTLNTLAMSELSLKQQRLIHL